MKTSTHSKSYFIVVNRTDEPYESQRDVITIAYDESKTIADRARATRSFLNVVSRFNRTSGDYQNQADSVLIRRCVDSER